MRRRRRCAHHCASCSAPDYLPALADPSICYRCAIDPRRAYAWRPAPFGRIRKVPATVGETW